MGRIPSVKREENALKKSKLWAGLTSLFAVILVIALIGNVLATANASYINSTLGISTARVVEKGEAPADTTYYKSQFGAFDDPEAQAKAIAAALEQNVNEMREGAALLMNRDSVLPLTDVTKVSVFGHGAVDPAYQASSAGTKVKTGDVNAVDLKTGAALAPNEQEWASTKDRTELTPYIAKALSILCEAGFSPAGVTSPWMFGIEVEDEYAAAISDALYEVTGRDTGWFFMRSRKGPGAKPWVEIGTDARTLVAVPATLSDRFWPSIDSSREGEEYSTEIADRLISKDGKSGEIIDVLESGGWPVLLSHWQSLMSNGRLTGLRALEKIAGRIEEHLSDRVEWKSCEEIMNIVAADRAAFPKPDFGD